MPIGLTAEDHHIWAVSASDGRLVDLDQPDRSARVGTTPLRVASFRNRLWVSVFGANRVDAVDPRTSAVVRRVTIRGQPEGIVGAYSRIWVVRQVAETLTSISTHGRVLRSVRVGKEPRLVTAGSGSLFVSNFGDGTVTRVNPRTNRAVPSAKLCHGPQGLAVANRTLWVACTTAGTVIAVDTQTLQLIGKVAVPDEPDAVRTSNGHIYVASTTGPTLHEIATDPEHPTIVRSVKLGSAAPLLDRANVDLAILGDEFWVSSPDDNRVFRLKW